MSVGKLIYIFNLLFTELRIIYLKCYGCKLLVYEANRTIQLLKGDSLSDFAF